MAEGGEGKVREGQEGDGDTGRGRRGRKKLPLTTLGEKILENDVTGL